MNNATNNAATTDYAKLGMEALHHLANVHGVDRVTIYVLYAAGDAKIHAQVAELLGAAYDAIRSNN